MQGSLGHWWDERKALQPFGQFVIVEVGG